MQAGNTSSCSKHFQLLDGRWICDQLALTFLASVMAALPGSAEADAIAALADAAIPYLQHAEFGSFVQLEGVDPPVNSSERSSGEGEPSATTAARLREGCNGAPDALHSSGFGCRPSRCMCFGCLCCWWRILEKLFVKLPQGRTKQWAALRRPCAVQRVTDSAASFSDRHCASKRVSYQEVYADSSLSDLPEHSGGDSDFEIAVPTYASSGRSMCAETCLSG